MAGGRSHPLLGVRGHTGPVYSVALSADERLFASSGEEGTVRLWEAKNGGLLATLRGHTGGVWGVALSADRELLASGGLDGTVRLWDTPFAVHEGAEPSARRTADSGHSRAAPPSGWRSLATLQGHTGPVFSVALSADGRLLASASQDGTVRLWEAPTGTPLATLQSDAGGVRGVALSADGRLLAVANWDGAIRLWEAPLATIDGDEPSPGMADAGHAAAAPPSAWRLLTTTLPRHTAGVMGVALTVGKGGG